MAFTKKAAPAPHAHQAQAATARLPAAPRPVLVTFAVPAVQRRCACGGGCPSCAEETAHGGALPVGPIGDRFEQEADQVSAKVMRMPAAPIQRDATESAAIHETDEDEPRISRRSLVQRRDAPGGDPAPTLSAQDSRTIERAHGGAPLPASIRDFMEPRFNADFSDVRVHAGAESARLNAGLQAQAFTYGRNIWLGAGESAGDLPLMAHELTHVLQQTPSLMRSARPPPRGVRSIQRKKNDYFALPGDFKGKSGGTKTHDTVMAAIAGEGGNTGLFFEVRIPGGKKGVSASFEPDESAVVGRADFYKAPTTIGVQFVSDAPDPEYLGSHRDLRIVEGGGAKRFDHKDKAAPIAKPGVPKAAAAKTCPGIPAPAICRIDAPTDIALGELKPGAESERLEGVGQLEKYKTGITKTAGKVNAFADANPDKIDPKEKRWTPTPRLLLKDEIQIPDKYKPFSTAGRKVGVIRYENGKPEYKAALEPAYLYVVPDPSHAGVWVYEWVPLKRPSDTRLLKQAQEAALTALNDTVIKQLNSKPEVKAKRKAGAPAALPPRIQRKQVDEPFKYSAWKDTFADWRKTGAAPYLRSKDEKGAEFLDTLVQIKQRTLPALEVPAGSEEVSTGLHKIKHWDEHGEWYGRLRGVFGGLYVKFLDFYEAARDRFRKLLPKTPRRTLGGGLPATLIRVGVKILKYVANMIIGQAAERLTDAFHRAAHNIIHNVFGSAAADLEEQLTAVRAYIADFEETIRKRVFQAIDDAIAPYRDYIETIQDVIAGLQQFSTWVNRAKWLARAASCFFPPLVGCLWGIFGTMALEAILSELVEQCSFRRDVMFPILRGIDFVKKLPGRIVDFILNGLINLLPGKAKELIGDVSRKEEPLRDDDACEDLPEEEKVPPPRHIPENFTPGPEQMEYARLFEKWDRPAGHPLMAAGALLAATGVNGNEPMTMAKLKRLDQFLENVKGDAAAIRRYIATLKQGHQKSRTFEEVLDVAESYIRNPQQPSIGVQIPLPSKPGEMDDRQKREGVIILKF
jgi:hypothetical protein